MNELEGKVALVVGGGSDLGRRASLALSDLGAWVGVNDWSASAAEKTVEMITSTGGAAKAFPIDSSKKMAFQTAFEALLIEQEKIDVLVNASVVEPSAELLDLDEWDWHRALDLNVGSVFLSMQSVGRVMRDLGKGVIINLLDADARQMNSVYGSSAAAIEALSDAFGQELAKDNIIVRAISTLAENGEVKKKITDLVAENTANA